MRVPWLAGLAMIVTACSSTKAPPTHFGPWGPIAQVQDPERSVLVAAIAALSGANAHSVVLARYAGDVYRRLDLESLSGQVPVTVDAEGKLGPIDTGPPMYRARVFEYDFPGKTTILELSIPHLHGGSASMTAWRWDALAWKCGLPGTAESLTLERVDGKWSVTVASRQPNVLLQAGCS